jgi:hypothetical protein
MILFWNPKELAHPSHKQKFILRALSQARRLYTRVKHRIPQVLAHSYGVIEALALVSPVLPTDNDAPAEKAAGSTVDLDEVPVAEEFLNDGFEVVGTPAIKAAV